MGRVLAIDYGRKRCGIAVTDVLKISANGLTTVRTCDLMQFLTEYCSKEDVERIVIGEPHQMNGQFSQSMEYIRPFIRNLKKVMPDMPIDMVDERYTSVIANRAIVEGVKKSERRNNKGLVDKVAAVIILTSWLERENPL